MGKDQYRLAKVTQTHPDINNVVRTVTFALRDGRKSKDAKMPLTNMRVGVQRLVVLLPIEEVWQQGLVTNPTKPQSS